MVMLGIIISTLIAGTFAENPCEIDSFSACAYPNTFPLNFPESEEDLDASCAIISRYMECVKDHEKECQGEFPHEEHYNKVYGTLQDICREDSELHSKLSKNIKCIKRELNNQKESRCSSDRAKTSQAFHLFHDTNRYQSTSERNREEWDMLYCLQHAVDISCFLNNVETCGAEAKDAAVDVIEKSDFVADGCPGGTLLNVTNLLPHLRLGQRLEHQIKDILKTAERSL